MTYDRAAVMRDAWVRFRDGKRLRLGWSFSQCLRTAWAAEKIRKGGRLSATDRQTVALPRNPNRDIVEICLSH